MTWRSYRRKFYEANPTGPWICYYCGVAVNDFSKVVVHHKDESWRNEDLENLVSIHKGCHTKVHPRKWSETSRREVGNRARGRVLTERQKKKISDSHKNRKPVSAETKRKMVAAQTARRKREAAGIMIKGRANGKHV